jgi:MFS transporter, FHS family, L-fucose permease
VADSNGAKRSTETVTETPPVRANAPETSASRGALAIVTLLFFMWGFLTSLNDILVPHLKAIFDLRYVEVMLIQFSFFSAYFVFAFPPLSSSSASATSAPWSSA